MAFCKFLGSAGLRGLCSAVKSDGPAVYVVKGAPEGLGGNPAFKKRDILTIKIHTFLGGD